MDQFDLGEDVKISFELTNENGQDIIPDDVPSCEVTDKDGFSVSTFTFERLPDDTYVTWWNTVDCALDVYVIIIEVKVNGKTFIKKTLVELV